MKHCYRAGIDIGSTTAKLVILDERGVLCYGDYRRHCAHTQETLAELLEDACAKLGPCDLRLKITGSGAINLGKALNIGFVQEVVAVASSLQAIAPQTDVAIELGGEDAKIIYFRGGLEERMNGVCAGGTGSFIDQMAALLQTDAEGLNRAAADYHELYPIAARCGVFAKSDIQPLINEGATLPDLAASIFQAVVNQTISGLACGKPIRGCVAFLGGPLHFLPELKKAFIRTLHLTLENIVDPDNSHLFAAMGAALEAGDAEPADAAALAAKLRSGVQMAFELKRLPPLFADRAEYDAFRARHDSAQVHKVALHPGRCFLGIDAGSTTLELVRALTGAALKATYVTNGVAHARLLAQKGCRVYLPGGLLRPQTEAIVGAPAVSSIQQYNFTKAFMGANGVALEAGFTTPDPEEAAVKAAAVRRARESWFLVDDAKFAKIYPAVITDLHGGAILTNRCPNPKYKQYTFVKEAEA